MEHINKVEIRGNVGTVRMNEHNGKKVVNFSVVTDFLYKSREGIPLSETTWHNVVAWSGKDIVDLELITKGAQVHVCGRIRANKYTSADGVEKFFYEIMASRLQIVTDVD
jgi:single-strand DNA-binding protein